MAEVGDGGFEELALGDLAVELVLSQEGEDLSDVFIVFGVGLAEYENVINVHNDRLIEEGAEDVLDQGLECGGSIGETERHHLVLVVAVARAEGGLLDVLFVDSDLVVAPMQVDLGEYFGTEEAVGEVVDEGNGEAVLDGDVVQGTVVDAHLEGTIFLLDKDDRGAKGGHTG